ncbi:hypothetical protein ACFQ9X_06235 [Catenulispora yoronensis]
MSGAAAPTAAAAGAVDPASERVVPLLGTPAAPLDEELPVAEPAGAAVVPPVLPLPLPPLLLLMVLVIWYTVVLPLLTTVTGVETTVPEVVGTPVTPPVGTGPVAVTVTVGPPPGTPWRILVIAAPACLAWSAVMAA